MPGRFRGLLPDYRGGVRGSGVSGSGFTLGRVDGYWIANAPGHRLAELEAAVVAMAELAVRDPQAPEPIVVDGGEEWICDRCNGPVPVFHDEGPVGPDPCKLPPEGCLRPVPVVAGQVLCPDCFARWLPDVGIARGWPGCGCAPCRATSA